MRMMWVTCRLTKLGNFVAPHGRITWQSLKGTTKRQITDWGGRVAADAKAQNAKTFRKVVLRALLGVLVGVPAWKITHACRPLFMPIEGPQEDEQESVHKRAIEPELLEAEGSTSRLWWLLSNASDRLFRDVATVVLIVLDYYRAQKRGDEDWTHVHEKGARRLLRLCQVNRGIYIKLGQHIAQLDYLLPSPYVTTMKKMLRECPETAWPQVCRVFEKELGMHPEAAYKEIDKKPMASASLAQVHIAKDANGNKYAIKVQHDGLLEMCEVDIRTISFLVDVVKWLFPKFEYTWLVREIKYNLPRELDFIMEGENAERCRENFKGQDQIVIPKIYWQSSSRKILTMSFEEGCYIDNREAIEKDGINPSDVATLVAEVFCQQMFLDGFVHADPHAGNMLCRRRKDSSKPEIVLLDHGLYRPLDDEFRVNYCHLWRSLIFGDEAGIRKYANKCGAGGMYQLFASMLTTKSWDKVVDPSFDSLKVKGSAEERRETKKYATEYSDEIQEILRIVPREMLLLLKTNDCLRSVDQSLGAPVNTFTIMARYCVKGINTHRRDKENSIRNSLRNFRDLIKVETAVLAYWLYSWWV